MQENIETLDKKGNHQDKFLLALIKQSNKDAFNVLFRYYYPGLVVFAMRYLHIKEESEEMVQDVFLKLWSERENLRIHTSLRDFLFTSVKNKCLDRIKHKKVQEKFDNLFRPTPNEITNYDLFVEQELRDMIKKTMDQLPTECRKVFVLSRIQNLKYKEVADKLGISVKTVENQISKALKIFRNALKDYL